MVQDNNKLRLILIFIKYHAYKELCVRLKKYLTENGKSTKNYYFNDVFILDSHTCSHCTIMHFMDLDFLNDLSSKYFEGYLENSSSIEKNDDELFIENNIKSIIEFIVAEKKLVNYVEEIIKLDKINVCNYVGKLGIESMCSNFCVGEKCLFHETTNICYI